MAYILSKLLPLAVLPLGLSLILLLIGLIARWRWPVITALLLRWFFSLGWVSQRLLQWLESPLATPPGDRCTEGRCDRRPQWRSSFSPRCCSRE